MHNCTPYGYLKVNNKVILIDNLSHMVGVNLDKLTRLLQELIDAGVCFVDDAGCYYSKRMVEDEVVRMKRAAGGHLGGNPKLKKGKKYEVYAPPEVNLKDNLQGYPSLANANTTINTDNKDTLSREDNNTHNILVVDEEVNLNGNHKVNLNDEDIKIINYEGNWTLEAPVAHCLHFFFTHKDFKNDRDKAFERIKYQLIELPDDELWERLKKWATVFNEGTESQFPTRSMRGVDCWPQHFINWFKKRDDITADPTKVFSKKPTNGVKKPQILSGNAPIEEQRAHYARKKRE